MPPTHFIQSSFTAGILCPRVAARTDIEQYYASASVLENFVVLPHGPITRRSGSVFVAPLKDETRPVLLRSFTFNRTQSYQLAFNAGVISFYTTEGVIVHDDGTDYTVAHPFTDEHLEEVHFTQLNDLVILTHQAYHPVVLKRLGHRDWKCEEIVFTNIPDDWDVGNFPGVSNFFEQRLYFAATPRQPQKLWGSVTADFFNFQMNSSGSESPLDRDAIAFTLSSDRSSEILWMTAKDKLLVGTVGSEFQMTSSKVGDALSPLNIRGVRVTTYGSKKVKPCILDDTLFFVQRGGRKLRAMAYQFASDSYSARDLSILASQLVDSGIKDFAYQSSPDSLLWILTEDSQVLGLTYESEHKVRAWHTHVIGKVLSLEVLDGLDHDQLWLVVEREVNGATRRYIEVVRHAFRDTEDTLEQYYSDSTISYHGEPTQVLTGLEHLEKEEVCIVVDGWVHPSRVVENGQITLDSPGSIVHVGLPFTSRFVSNRLTSVDAPMFYHEKNASQGILTVINSLGMQMGVHGEPLADVMSVTPRRQNKAPALETGDLKVNFRSTAQADLKLEIVQSKPLPCTVAALSVKVGANSL